MVNHRAAPTPLLPGLCRTRHFWGEAAWEVWGSSRAGGRVGSSSPTHINLGPQGATFPVGSTLNQSENWPHRRSVPTLAWAGGWGGRTVSPGCWHTTQAGAQGLVPGLILWGGWRFRGSPRSARALCVAEADTALGASTRSLQAWLSHLTKKTSRLRRPAEATDCRTWPTKTWDTGITRYR